MEEGGGNDPLTGQGYPSFQDLFAPRAAPSISGYPLLLIFNAEFRTVLVSLIGLEPIPLSGGGFEPPASAIPPQG